MEILLKKVKIIDPFSPYNNKRLDVYIKNGHIAEVGREINKKCKVFDVNGACISIGWLDMGAQMGEPGFEYREDVQSISLAAAKGGFTGLAAFPNTFPVIDSKSNIGFLQNKFQDEIIEYHAIASITKGADGVELSEMIDLHHHGAIAFSDGTKAVENDRLLLLAMQYVKRFDGLIIHHPYNDALIPDGQMHEGKVSTSLGLMGIPEIAETVVLDRDLALTQYSESRVLLHNISCAASCQKIKQFRRKYHKLYASVSVMNLVYTDEQNGDFDTLWKVIPPLRGKKDRTALIKGIVDGSIDLISSNHVPVEIEGKHKEFTYAKFGALGLQTTFSLAWEALSGQLKIHELIHILGYNPRKILGIGTPIIKEGELANLTLFHPGQSWELREEDIASKSKNSPIVGRILPGKVWGVINKDKIVLHQP